MGYRKKNLVNLKYTTKEKGEVSWSLYGCTEDFVYSFSKMRLRLLFNLMTCHLPHMA